MNSLFKKVTALTAIFLLSLSLALPSLALGAATIKNSKTKSFTAKSQTVTKGGYIKLSAYYVMPGQTFTVYGYQFSPNENVSVTAFGSTQTAIADNGGNFSSSAIIVPDTALNTKSTITAKGNSSGKTASAVATIANNYPVISPSSYFAVPGSQIRFFGQGFLANEQIQAKDPAGKAILPGLKADSSGSFSTPLVTIPYKGSKQTYSFTGQTSKTTKTVTVATSGGTPSYVTLSSYAGRPGSLIRISGFLFGANENVTLSFQGTTLGATATDNSGNFSALARVPTQEDNAIAILTATGQSTGKKAQIGFMVNDYR